MQTAPVMSFFSGVPENDLNFEEEALTDDKSKVRLLSTVGTETNFVPNRIKSCVRIGEAKKGPSRLLKVTFNEVDFKQKMMLSQRNLRDCAKVVKAFGRIYVNQDSSYLMRKEEKRLRNKLKTMKAAADDPDAIYIRRGTLYRNNEVVDKINIANQLF